MVVLTPSNAVTLRTSVERARAIATGIPTVWMGLCVDITIAVTSIPMLIWMLTAVSKEKVVNLSAYQFFVIML